MSFVGYFEFQQGSVKRLGIFSSCARDVDSFSVQICERTDQSLKLLGEQHLTYLPMVYVDRRRSLKLSVVETADKRPVYIVNRRFFALEGGCRVIFREGQVDVYGISKEWLRENDQLTELSDGDLQV